MAERADVVVVGAGVGGLATAIRLAATGRRVVVVERRPVVGGKLATERHDGFTFDVGPSLLTMPTMLDELFQVAGGALTEELDLVRLDPQFQYRWPDGSVLTMPDQPPAVVAAFDALAPGSGARWRRFDARGQRIWNVSKRTFLAGPMDGPFQLLRRMGAPGDVVAIQPVHTLHRLATRSFRDPRLVQWVGRYATYSGSSPYRAPATLACIPHLESHYGCWYPMGGLDTVRAALERTATRLGVDVRCGAEVVAIRAIGRRVAGVELADGAAIDSPVVVANADAEHVYGELLADGRQLHRVRRADRSMSGLVVLAAVAGHTAGLHHHNVWFAADDRAEFAALHAGRMADDPTVYACVSAVTDPTQAPSGDENWFLLVNTPPGIDLDGPAERDRVFATLAGRGVDLRPRVRWTHMLTPADLAARYRAPGGAIYGASSNGRRAAFLRPRNRSPYTGLYLVGGSSHPGGGLPLVLTSARIVADLIAAGVHGAGR